MRYCTILICIISCCMFCSCNQAGNPEDEIKLFPIIINNKTGYIDHDGKIVINPQFAYGALFSEHRALVKNDEGLYGYIDETGKYIVYPQYVMATSFSEGLAAVAKPDSPCQYIDPTGKLILTIEKADEVGMFHDGMAPYYHNGKGGYINKSGSKMIAAQYFDVEGFFDGLARVGIRSDSGKDSYGYIDTKGRVVINFQFDDERDFKDGMAAVMTGSKYGYIDKTGKYTVNPQFELAGDFCNGLAIVKIDKHYGYIDKMGKIVINPQFDDAANFSGNGLAPVGMKNDDVLKCGYIDKEGKYVINPQYNAVSEFWGGVAFAGDLDNLGLIDAKGASKANPQFKTDMMMVADEQHSLSNSFIYAQTHDMYYDAAAFIACFYSFNFEHAAAYAMPQTIDYMLDIERYFERAGPGAKKDLRGVTQRIINIEQTDSNRALVSYLLSSHPNETMLLPMQRYNGKWLALLYTKSGE